MPDLRTPTTGTFFTGGTVNDVPAWNGVEWIAASPHVTVGPTTTRPAGVVDGTMFLDVTLNKPIWAVAAALPTGWIDALGAVV